MKYLFVESIVSHSPYQSIQRKTRPVLPQSPQSSPGHTENRDFFFSSFELKRTGIKTMVKILARAE